MSREKLDFILTRTSVRNFKADAISEEDTNLLIEAARRAPSAGNCQPWFFYVVRRESIKKGLVGAAYGQGFIAEAPLVFVVCAEPGRSASRYGERGEGLYCIQDTAAAVENVLIAANALGYGACWVGAFDESKAAQVLSVPANLRPVAIVPIGRPARKSALTPRRRVDDTFAFMD